MSNSTTGAGSVANQPAQKEEIEKLLGEAREQKTSSIRSAIDTLYILSDRLNIDNENKGQKGSVRSLADNQAALDIAYYSKLGNILYELEKYEEAFTACDEVEKIVKKNVKVAKFKGDCLEKLGKFEEAIKEYDGGMKKWSKDTSSIKEDGVAILRGRGLAYTNKGDYEKALADFNEAIDLDGNNALVWCLKGRALNKDGKEHEALDCFNKALEINKASNTTIGLNSSDINLINQTLSQDREALLKKVSNVQETPVQTQQPVDKLDKPNLAANKAADIQKPEEVVGGKQSSTGPEASSPGKSPTKGTSAKISPEEDAKAPQKEQPTACCGIF